VGTLEDGILHEIMGCWSGRDNVASIEMDE